MSSRDRVNAVLIGKVRDADGFPGELLEDPDTGARFIAYSIETWEQRSTYLTGLKLLSESERSILDRDTFEVVHETPTTDPVAD